MHHHAHRRPLVLLAALLALTACAVQVADDPLEQDQELVEEVPEGANRIPLDVQEGPGGQILAFVPVTIGGEGPFPFALDTGASSTSVDRDISGELGLPESGPARDVTGVGGATEAVMVQVDDWQLGEVELATQEVIALDLPDADRGIGLAGLLGSDILDDFGRITIDYEEEVLIVEPRS